MKRSVITIEEPKPKHPQCPLPQAPRAFTCHTYERKTKWDPIEIPARVTALRAQGHVRHLGDLLLQLGIPWGTSRSWSTTGKARTVPDWRNRTGGKRLHRSARVVKQEWLDVCAGVPIPRNHDLHFLRYITHPVLAKFAERRDAYLCELMAEIEAGDHTAASGATRFACHTAADEVIRQAYAAGSARRSMRRAERNGGVDPVPARRIPDEHRGRRKAFIAGKPARRKAWRAMQAAEARQAEKRFNAAAKAMFAKSMARLNADVKKAAAEYKAWKRAQVARGLPTDTAARIAYLHGG